MIKMKIRKQLFMAKHRAYPRLRSAIACLAAAILATTLTACNTSSAKEAPNLLEPVGAEIETATVARGNIDVFQIYPASVIPETEAFSFDVDGRITAVHVTLGQDVKAGTPLLEIERVNESQVESLEKELENLEASWAHDKKIHDLQLEKLNVENNRLKANSASQAELDYHKLRINEATLNRKQAQERYELRHRQISGQLDNYHVESERMQILAPRDSRVIYLPNLKIDDTVQAYDSVIALADLSQILVRSEFVSEYYLKDAIEVSATIEGQTHLLAAQPVDLTEYMNIVLNDGTPYTYYDIENVENTELESGSYAVVKVVSQRAENSLRLPVNTIYREGRNRYVYVVEDKIREKRQVEVGIANDSWIEILDGLEEGEEVFIHD